jgi:hypothetical protein
MQPYMYEMLARERVRELSRQAAHERLIIVLERRRREQARIYHWWAYSIGRLLVRWGRRLERFGAVQASHAS